MKTETDIPSLQAQADQLNEQAWDMKITDAKGAKKVSEEALTISEAIGYTHGKATALRTLGFSHMRLFQHDEATKYLQQSLSCFEDLKDSKGQSDVYEILGVVQRNLNDFGGSLDYLYKSLELRQKVDYPQGEALSYYHLGVTYKYLGNYEKALEYLLESLALTREIKYTFLESYALNLIGQVYSETGVYESALEYYQQSLQLRQQAGDSWGEAGSMDNIGFIYYKMGEYKKAADCCSQALAITKAINDEKGKANTFFHLAHIYQQSGEWEKALDCCSKSWHIREQIADKKGEAETLLFLAEIYETALTDQYDDHIIDLLTRALDLAEDTKALDIRAKIHYVFYKTFKQFNLQQKALQHLENYLQVDKEMNTEVLKQKVLNLEITHHAEQSRKEAEIFRLRNVELASLYEESKKQKEEIEEQKKVVEQSLQELKETQSQLIQRERLASLGELTAGIAHEIQNPLNFVTNFSEVSMELVQEIEKDLQASAQGDALVSFQNIKQNLEKINYHGKRADAIVKGMLQHSRARSGEKEVTDINALADEYLRLSYHGLRAKDKAFNATLEVQFDNSIQKINIIPQDIGRVLLNLFNNAFYAVTEKKKAAAHGYEPTVWVSTKSLKDKIEIRVKDNGDGIPQAVLNKIFQPFFTTKPVGQGTGLGLSLSYDIITKGHGGEMRVETVENSFAEFIIELPVSRQ